MIDQTTPYLQSNFYSLSASVTFNMISEYPRSCFLVRRIHSVSGSPLAFAIPSNAACIHQRLPVPYSSTVTSQRNLMAMVAILHAAACPLCLQFHHSRNTLARLFIDGPTRCLLSKEVILSPSLSISAT